jgi:cytidylate kinase
MIRPVVRPWRRSITEDSIPRCAAIDGPTASGKSVVGRALANRLTLGFFDTGLMYRACALGVLRTGVDPGSEHEVTAVVRGLDLDISWPEPTDPRLILGGEDVTGQLRAREVEATVSLVSRVSEVRAELVRRQRAIAAREPVVMAGRDIGTRVLPEARTKIFLDASMEVRARRRLGEEQERGMDSTFEGVLAATQSRDHLDDSGDRAVRREQAAADAIIIDTDEVGIDQVVERCVEAYTAANSDA